MTVGGAKKKTAPTLKEQIAALQEQEDKRVLEEADRIATAERHQKAFAAKKEAEKKLEAEAVEAEKKEMAKKEAEDKLAAEADKKEKADERTRKEAAGLLAASTLPAVGASGIVERVPPPPPLELPPPAQDQPDVVIVQASVVADATTVVNEAAPPSTKLRVTQLVDQNTQLQAQLKHLVERFEATQSKKRLTVSDLIKNVCNPQSSCNTNLQHQFLTKNTLDRIEQRLKKTLALEMDVCKKTCSDLRKDIQAIRVNRERSESVSPLAGSKPRKRKATE